MMVPVPADPGEALGVIERDGPPLARLGRHFFGASLRTGQADRLAQLLGNELHRRHRSLFQAQTQAASRQAVEIPVPGTSVSYGVAHVPRSA